MIINNQSRIPTETVQPLIDFVTFGIPYDGFSVVNVFDNEKRKTTVGEMSYLGNLTNTVPLFKVDIGIGKGKRYPKFSLHRKRVGGVYFRNIEEEFLFVFAHEFRHILQHPDKDKIKQYEVDAERWAVNMLKQYRLNKEKRTNVCSN